MATKKATTKPSITKLKASSTYGKIAKPSDHGVGLYRKFDVERADGSSGPGKKHENCEYFVLDLMHDPYAAVALIAYAGACEEDYPQLAADIIEKVGSKD